MTNKPPATVAADIKNKVYEEADRFNYLGKSRTENGRFVDGLVENPDIGGKLTSYMAKSQVRTYIKDAILNRYSKDKTAAARPRNIPEIILEKFGFPVTGISTAGTIEVYKSMAPDKANAFVVSITDGTFLKWETALKKALLFLPGKPFFDSNENEVFILINVFAQGRPIPSSDKNHLNKALGSFKTYIHVYGER